MSAEPDPQLVREIAPLSDENLAAIRILSQVQDRAVMPTFVANALGLAADEIDRLRAERDALTARVAELEGERDADVRAVARLLRELRAYPDVNALKAVTRVEERFAEPIAALEAVALRTPEQWCAHYDVEIVDPDGWRRADDPPWDEPITLPDFWNRAARSTLRNAVGENWQRAARDARAALDARTTDGGTT